MSRTDYLIWQVKTTIGPLQTYRSTKIGVDAKPIALNEKILQLAYLFFLRLKLNPDKLPVIPPELFMGILTFHFGCHIRENGMDVLGSMQQLLLYAFNTMRPFEIGIRKKTVIYPSRFFPVESHPDFLIEAVLHGDEKVVQTILRMNPDLSQMGTGMDFSGRPFTGTALQAAIACTDFAANENSTGLCELIVEALKRQHPDHCHQIFESQALALYTKSLRFYAEKQADKIRALTAKKEAGEMMDEAVIETAKARHQAYLAALDSKDLTIIINAHTAEDENTPDAQKDHALEVDPALIDAVANATDDEIQAVLNDPTINSTLSNLLKQFKADVTKLSHEEIIFNPQHLIKIFALYNTFCNRFAAADENWMTRNFFWDHLAEFAMCYLPADTAQIFANPGLYATVENKAKNQRSFDFKYGGGSIFPPVVSSIDPRNIKLAVACWVVWGMGTNGVKRGRCFFKTYVEQKTASLQDLLRRFHQHVGPSRRCVIQ